MSPHAIRVENLSKLYRIGLAEQKSETLAGAVAGFLRSPWRNFRRLRSLSNVTTADGDAEDVIWALKDVSFVVDEGEVLGVIGSNGAGKSTLLKILAGITEPTGGRVVGRGRIASLLEVGTGFHPDLTGRENIYLNGTILGMKKAEIDKRFDEIVDFSGVGEFIDTPVKRYSSGMSVRLAFSVAVHLEADTLLIDEVLAVGDARFQQQCFDRMAELASGGKTILFVSHNLPAVSRLCQRSVVLSEGRLSFLGSVHSAISAYTASLAASSGLVGSTPAGAGIEVLDPVLDPPDGNIQRGQPFSLEFRLRIHREYWRVAVQLGVSTFDGNHLVISTVDSDQEALLRKPGELKLRAELPPLWLQPLRYPLRIKVMASPAEGETERVYSSWLNLSVLAEQNLDAHTSAILAPEVRWSFLESEPRMSGARSIPAQGAEQPRRDSG